MPASARHVVLSAINSFKNGLQKTVVADVQFLAEGGGLMNSYSHVPVLLNEIVLVLQKMPKVGGKKQILVSNVLNRYLNKQK